MRKLDAIDFIIRNESHWRYEDRTVEIKRFVDEFFRPFDRGVASRKSLMSIVGLVMIMVAIFIERNASASIDLPTLISD